MSTNTESNRLEYRINSKRATAFRQWATAVLRDFAIRGYVIDRKRMENGAFLGEDYFEHLLAGKSVAEGPTLGFLP